LLQRERERWPEVNTHVLLIQLLLSPQTEELGKTKFNTPRDLTTFSQKFDEGVKRVFSNDQGTHHVRFGSPRDNDPEHGIKAGRLTLTG